MTARAHLPKHPRQGAFFRWLQRAGITSESLAQYVADCTGVAYAAGTVRGWASGRLPVDAEAVFLALDHAGDDVGVVLDALCREYGHRAVPLQVAEVPLVEAMCAASRAHGEVTARAVEALADGRIDAEEAAALLGAAEADAEASAALVRTLRGLAGVPTVRAAAGVR